MSLLLIIVVLAVVALLAVAARKPNDFRLQRSTVIQAAPEKIFPLINELSQWERWSPWEKMDPNMKKTLSGPPSGVGAVSAWEGDRRVGSGRMEIMESQAPQKIVLRLDFFKPMKAQHMAEFTLQPKDGGTEVTWAMYGQQPFIGKVFSVFCQMEKMVGPEFEKGLAAMKKAAEAA